MKLLTITLLFAAGLFAQSITVDTMYIGSLPGGTDPVWSALAAVWQPYTMVQVKDTDPANVAWSVTLEWTDEQGAAKVETHIVSRTPNSELAVAIFATGKASVKPATAVPLTVGRQAGVESRAVRHLAVPSVR